MNTCHKNFEMQLCNQQFTYNNSHFAYCAKLLLLASFTKDLVISVHDGGL